ncbi:MAG: hypothetical protein ABI183_24005 [Polyangiaceae bacterium]
MQRTLLLVLVAFFLAAVLGACGSRGPLDDDIVAVTDAGITDAITDQVSLPDVAVVDSAPPVVDAGTGLIQCGTCVAQQCGPDVTQCLTDPSCQAVLTCVATTCFNLGGIGGEGGGGGGGGGIDPSCLLGCTSSGGSGVGEALGIFQCITGSCGSQCGGLLGGLGGLGGGIPDPAPPAPGSNRHVADRDRSAMFEHAFSAWPELSSSWTPAHPEITSAQK